MRRLLWYYLALLVLLAAMIGLSFWPSPWGAVAIMALAVTQAALLLGGFVELGRSSALVRLMALGAGFFLLLMALLVFADLWSRPLG